MERFDNTKKILFGFLNFAMFLGLGVAFALYNPAGLGGINTSPDEVFKNEVAAIGHVHRPPQNGAPTEETPTEIAAATAVQTPAPPAIQSGGGGGMPTSVTPVTTGHLPAPVVAQPSIPQVSTATQTVQQVTNTLHTRTPVVPTKLLTSATLPVTQLLPSF